MSKIKTLKEVTNDVAAATGMAKTETDKFIKWMNSYIKQELKKNGEFNLFGLGKLVIVRAKARKGINPATGKKITIPASNRIKLRAGKDFKESVNKR
ncbi:MAG: HU family DNA-binding protein [Mycoplasma sp.]|nr:HU family DNA-binding protein [Mycoplasma sp.]